MRGRHSALCVQLSPEERVQIEHWLRSTTTPVGLARRAKALLLVSQGHRLIEAARRAGLAERHVRKWLTRFIDQGLQGLQDRKGRGRKPSFSPCGPQPRPQNRL
jgi:hypothetical protein